jgi:hypothetical protein
VTGFKANIISIKRSRESFHLDKRLAKRGRKTYDNPLGCKVQSGCDAILSDYAYALI